MRAGKIQMLCKKLNVRNMITESQIGPLKEKWMAEFDQRMFAEVEDLMADSGELSDGELPSHTLANLRESGFAENTDAYNEGSEFEDGLARSRHEDGEHGGRKTGK